MIVRDEAHNLAACLTPLRDIIDEIVVVDTGSMDDTKTVAVAHGAQVYDYVWSDSFGAARNATLDRATADWVLTIDADDRFVPSECDKLGALLQQLRTHSSTADAFTMTSVSIASDKVVTAVVDQVRLFRRHPTVRWQYRLHEQIVPSLERARCSIAKTGIRIVHVGYVSDEVLSSKHERNLRLAELDCADHPTEPLPMYYRAALLLELGRPHESIVALSIAAPLLGIANLAGQNAHIMLIRALREVGDIERALATVRDIRCALPRQITLASMEAELHVLLGDIDTAARVLTALDLDNPLTGADFYAAILLSEVWMTLGFYSAAESAGRNVIRRRPSEGRAWLVVADALLAQGSLDKVERLHEALDGASNKTGALLVRAGLLACRSERRAALDTLQASGDALAISLRERLRLHGTFPLVSCLAWPWL